MNSKGKEMKTTERVIRNLITMLIIAAIGFLVVKAVIAYPALVLWALGGFTMIGLYALVDMVWNS